MTHRQGLYLILAVALLLRVGFGLTQSADLTQASDERHWDALGKAYLALGVLLPDTGMYRPPLYGLFLAGIYRMFGHAPAIVRIAQAVIGAITCWLIFLIGCKMGRGNARVGLVGAALFAIYPLFVFFPAVLMAETLLVFLTTVSFVGYLRFSQQSTHLRAMAFGGAVGLSALCKTSLIAVALARALGMDMALSPAPRPKSRARRGSSSAAVIAVIAPWTARNDALSGEIVPISANLGINLLVGAHPQGRGYYDNRINYLAQYHTLADTSHAAVADRKVVGIVLGWIAHNPLHYLRLSIDKLFYFWCPWVPGESPVRTVVAALSCGPVLLLGLAGAYCQRRTVAGMGIVSLVICMSALHMVFFAHTRFRLPIDAILCAPAALGLGQPNGKTTCVLKPSTRATRPCVGPVCALQIALIAASLFHLGNPPR